MPCEEIYRYAGLGEESEFGTLVPAEFHLDPASGTLDSPPDNELVYEGSLGRGLSSHRPGPYIPAGNLEFAWDFYSIALLLRLALGDAVSADNTDEITDEDHPTGAGETSLNFTTVETPVIPGTFVLNDATPTLVAHDDGLGNIVEDGSSGVAGTIDYATGAVTLTGLTESTAYTIDYEWGTFQHVIKPRKTICLPSASVHVGKSFYEHAFAGSILSQLVLTTEREFARAACDWLCKIDSKEAIVLEANLLRHQESKKRQVVFHEATFKIDTVQVKAENIVLTINNNGDGEAGVRLASRFPAEIYSGNLDIGLAFNLKFESTDEKEDFWGGATGPAASGPVELAGELSFVSAVNSSLKAVFDIPRFYMSAVPHPFTGRDRLVQAIAGQVLYDETLANWIKATVDTTYAATWAD